MRIEYLSNELLYIVLGDLFDKEAASKQ